MARLLRHLRHERRFTLSLVWTPDGATGMRFLHALQERYPRPQTVLDVSEWRPEEIPFLDWVLGHLPAAVSGPGDVCILTGFSGPTYCRHPLRHLNVNRNQWMHARPCHWIFLIPTYEEWRRVAAEAGEPGFLMGDEMPDVYSVRSGDYLLQRDGAEPTPAGGSEGIGFTPEGCPGELRALAETIQLLERTDPGETVWAQALYAHLVAVGLTPLARVWRRGDVSRLAELAGRARGEALSPAVAAQVHAVRAGLGRLLRDPTTPALARSSLVGLEQALKQDHVLSSHLQRIAETLDLLHTTRVLDSLELRRQAVALAAQAVPRIEDRLGAESPTLATALLAQADLLYEAGEVRGSLEPARRAVAIREAQGDSGSAALILALHDLAVLEGEAGNWDTAVALHRRVLDLRRQTLRSSPAGIGDSLFCLATLYERRGHLGPAEEAYQQALEAYVGALGRSTPQCASCLLGLARVFAAGDRSIPARGLAQEALDILESTSGSGDPQVLGALNLLADLEERTGRLDEAGALFARAHAAACKQVGAEHPTTAALVLRVAQVRSQQGRNEEAARLMHEAIWTYEKTLGSDHPLFAHALACLADLLLGQGDGAAAQTSADTALRVYEAATGPDSIETAAALNLVARACATQGRGDLARPLFQRALTIFTDRLGADHAHSRTLRRHLRDLDNPA